MIKLMIKPIFIGESQNPQNRENKRMNKQTAERTIGCLLRPHTNLAENTHPQTLYFLTSEGSGVFGTDRFASAGVSPSTASTGASADEPSAGGTSAGDSPICSSSAGAASLEELTSLWSYRQREDKDNSRFHPPIYMHILGYRIKKKKTLDGNTKMNINSKNVHKKSVWYISYPVRKHAHKLCCKLVLSNDYSHPK